MLAISWVVWIMYMIFERVQIPNKEFTALQWVIYYVWDRYDLIELEIPILVIFDKEFIKWFQCYHFVINMLIFKKNSEEMFTMSN